MIRYNDVILTVVLLVIAVLGFLYELAGEMVPGWHTISYSAHRHFAIRTMILSAVLGLFVLLSFHFASNQLAREVTSQRM